MHREPGGRAAGLFLSHPYGFLEVTREAVRDFDKLRGAVEPQLLEDGLDLLVFGYRMRSGVIGKQPEVMAIVGPSWACCQPTPVRPLPLLGRLLREAGLPALRFP